MHVITLQNDPSRVPIGDPTDRMAADLLIESLAWNLGEAIREIAEGQVSPELASLRQLARDFAKGKHVVFICMHTEPESADPQQNGRRFRLFGR